MKLLIRQDLGGDVIFSNFVKIQKILYLSKKFVIEALSVIKHKRLVNVQIVPVFQGYPGHLIPVQR